MENNQIKLPPEIIEELIGKALLMRERSYGSGRIQFPLRNLQTVYEGVLRQFFYCNCSEICSGL